MWLMFISLCQLVARLRTALVDEITKQNARTFINTWIGYTGKQLYGAAVVECTIIADTATACKIHSIVPPG